MIEYTLTGLTNRKRLVETILEHTKLQSSYEDVNKLIDTTLIKCVEFWDKKILCGYGLIFKNYGLFNFHGYKLVRGRTRDMLYLAKEMIKGYNDIFISHTNDNKGVNKLAKFLGFVQINKNDKVTLLRRLCK